MPKGIQKYLDKVYSDFLETDEYKKLRLQAKLIHKASRKGLALGGSTGLHFAYGHATKLPGDLDFITDNHMKAWEFMQWFYMGIRGYKHHARMYIQNQTDWCPTGTLAHYKLSSSLHMDLCIMVLPKGALNKWYNECGVCVQAFDDIVAAAKELTKRDNKPRVELFEDFEDPDIPECTEEEICSLAEDVELTEEEAEALDKLTPGDVIKRIRDDRETESYKRERN